VVFQCQAFQPFHSLGAGSPVALPLPGPDNRRLARLVEAASPLASSFSRAYSPNRFQHCEARFIFAGSNGVGQTLVHERRYTFEQV